MNRVTWPRVIQLVATLAFVNLQIILGNLALARLDTVIALIVFFAIGLSLIVIAWLLQRLTARDLPDLRTGFLGLSAAAVFWGVVTGFLLGYFCVPEYLNLQTGGSTREIPVAEAPRYGGIGHRHFHDARVRPELAGEFVIHYRQKDGSDSSKRYRVAPVVDAGWTPAQPVQLWAGTTSESFSFSTWAEDQRATQGVLLHKGVYYRKAVVDARERHGVKEALGAPVLRLDPRPYEELISRARRWTLLLLLFASGLWTLFFLRARGLRGPPQKQPG